MGPPPSAKFTNLKKTHRLMVLIYNTIITVIFINGKAVGISNMDTVVISVGGSIIIPEKVDVEFLRKFRKVILDFISKGNKVVVVAGGGNICREYNIAAKEVTQISDIDLDWMGIAATRLNAELLRVIFSSEAYEKVIYNPTEKIKTDKKIIVGSGWEPGCSSDKDAVLLAINLGAKTVINMSNIDHVYDKDPNKFSDAKRIEKSNWDDFLNITGDKWIPGMHVPFDPEASKLCKENGLKVIILNGNDVKNLEKALVGDEFIGTVVE